jgi:hypothetical protein
MRSDQSSIARVWYWSEDTACMVHRIVLYCIRIFKEYIVHHVVPFLRLGLGSGLRFMCANRKQKYDGQNDVPNDVPYMKYLPTGYCSNFQSF